MASNTETDDKQRDRKSAFRILIVEDEFVVANDLRIILERAGYVVVGIAASFEEADISVGQVAPDIVLLDIMLHGHKTGIDVANILKARNIPYVYLTANSND